MRVIAHVCLVAFAIAAPVTIPTAAARSAPPSSAQSSPAPMQPPGAIRPANASSALDPRTAIYELRTYYPGPGKLAALNARFREHTLALFARHGMTNVAYWNEAPSQDHPDGRVIYILAYPSRDAREQSWKAFGSDPEWRAVAAASEVHGKLVTKVDSVFMTMTDYSPPLSLRP